MKKPNVLLILCDQMNPFLSSPYGDEARDEGAAGRLLQEATTGFDYGRFKEKIEQSQRNRKLILRGVRDPSERPWRFFPESRDIMWH